MLVSSHRPIDNDSFLPQMVRVLRELSPVLHMANLLASEMIHFVHQMAYYITFEVRIFFLWTRSSLLVRPSDCQCQSRNSTGFDPSLRFSGI